MFFRSRVVVVERSSGGPWSAQMHSVTGKRDHASGRRMGGAKLFPQGTKKTPSCARATLRLWDDMFRAPDCFLHPSVGTRELTPIAENYGTSNVYTWTKVSRRRLHTRLDKGNRCQALSTQGAKRPSFCACATSRLHGPPSLGVDETREFLVKGVTARCAGMQMFYSGVESEFCSMGRVSSPSCGSTGSGWQSEGDSDEQLRNQLFVVFSC